MACAGNSPSVDDGPMLFVLAPAVDGNCASCGTHKTISDVDRNHQRSCGVFNDDGSLSADVPSIVVENC